MNLIRKLKISEIVPVEFTETEQKIIEFIDESYPDEIKYMKTDGTFIMRQDNKGDILWVRYKGFWEVLHSEFCII